MNHSNSSWHWYTGQIVETCVSERSLTPFSGESESRKDQSLLARLLSPRLQLVFAPVCQVVHVCEQLVPCHHTWSRIRGDEAWASCTLRVCADLLAHVLAQARKLVLHTNAVLQVSRRARLLTLHILHMLQQVLRLCLKEREICTAEHRLC